MMIKIRKACIDDVQKLQALDADVFIDDPKYDSDRILGWSLSENGKAYFINLLNNTTYCCLVAENNNKLVGYNTALPKKFDQRKSKYLEIDNLGVRAEYQRQGIGKMLIENCLVWAKANGFQKVYLHSFYTNDQARAFYKKNGFSEIHVSFEKDL